MVSDSPFLVPPRATGWLFPGQGSQHVGMARDLAESFSGARRAFEEADDVLGFSLSRLCFEGPEEELTDTINAQPALLAASVATLRALGESLRAQGDLSAIDGALPHAAGTGGNAAGTGGNAAAGHSMGEYTALVAAGSLDYADGLRLVRTRGRLMKEAGMRTPGMMAAVLGLDESQVADICAGIETGIVQVANDNCPGQVVISGDRTGMQAAMAALGAAGAKKVIPLAVSIAAHSPLMAPAAAELREAIAATPLRPPLIPVYGNTSAQPLTSVDAIREELGAQLTGSVRWTRTIQAMGEAGITSFVEVGPGEVLAGLVKRIDRKAARAGIRDAETLRAWLQGAGAQPGN